MFLTADEMITPGGPSAPVWAFLTAITLALITLFGQQIAAKREAKRTREEATQAHKSAAQAEENTSSIANGFAGRMDRKLDAIIAEQDSQGDALRKHLEWHLNKNER